MGMKTTLDISDNLLRRAKELARKENLTLRSLVEGGLELVLKAREERGPHKVKPVVFRGKGLSEQFRGASWAEIRRAVYEGQGA